MICNLCRGSGALVCFWPLEWWPCPKCKGNGATHQYGPREFGGER